MRTLLIDNYDSYTYNLYQLISDVSGVVPLVVANDHVTAERVRQLQYCVLHPITIEPQLHQPLCNLQIEEMINADVVQNIVISPGPGSPSVPADVGVVPQVLRQFAEVPILGVCLGHQALASVHGAAVVRAPEPCHGRLSDIQHNGHELFADMPSGKGSGFRVVRYHSLVVEEPTLPAYLQPICWTAGGDVALTVREEVAKSSSSDDRLLMGIAHRSRPHFGVQYHPESVATGFGKQLMRNFLRIAADSLSLHSHLPALPAPPPPQLQPQSPFPPGYSIPPSLDASAQLSLSWKAIAWPVGMDSRDVFAAMQWSGQAETFWLDSSDTERARFSFMGGPGGPLWRKFLFNLPPAAHSPGADAGGQRQGVLTEIKRDGSQEQHCCSFRAWVDAYMRRNAVRCDGDELPFDFVGGLVGFLGYEMKAESGGANAHSSRWAPLPTTAVHTPAHACGRC